MKELFQKYYQIFSKMYQIYYIVTLIIIALFGLLFRQSFGAGVDIIAMYDVVLLVGYMFISIFVLNILIFRNDIWIEQIKEIDKPKTIAMFNLLVPSIAIMILPLLYGLTYIIDAGFWFFTYVLAILVIFFLLTILLSLFLQYFFLIFKLPVIRMILPYKLIGVVVGFFFLYFGGKYILEEVIVLPQNSVFWYNFFWRFNEILIPILFIGMVGLIFYWYSKLYEELGEIK